MRGNAGESTNGTRQIDTYFETSIEHSIVDLMKMCLSIAVMVKFIWRMRSRIGLKLSYSIRIL